jgi:hypothetical protein
MFSRKFRATAMLSACLSAAACTYTTFNDNGRGGSAGPTPAQATEPSPQPSGEPAGKALGATFEVGRALAQLYGSYDPATKRARWQPTSAELAKFGFGPAVKEVYSNVLLAAPFSENGSERYFVLTKTLPTMRAGRGVSPALGGALYTKAGDAWFLNLATRHIARLEAYDKLSKAQVVRLGAQRHGLLFRWSFSNAGFTEEGAVLVAEHNRSLSRLLALNVGGSNESDCDPAGSPAPNCWSYKSRLEFVPGENQDYYDLLVTTEGTRRLNGGEVAPVNETRRYLFVNGQYAASVYNNLANR